MHTKRKTDRIKTAELRYSEALLNAVRAAPLKPGCYLFKDPLGYVIYVGKAKSLRPRVRSYFTDAAREDERVIPLLPAIADVEFQTTDTELDALMLEHRLIKRLKPRFNALMSDESRRSWLRISVKDEYPAIAILEEPLLDDALYFNIVMDEYDGAEMLEAINTVWKTPLCEKTSFDEVRRACVFGQTRTCAAPCERRVPGEEYRRRIDEIVNLINGGRPSAVAALEAERNRLASDMKFEEAAAIHGRLDKLARLRRRFEKMASIPALGNAVVIARAYRAREAALFFFSDGYARLRRDLSLDGDVQRVSRFTVALGAEARNVADDGWMGRALNEIGAEKAICPTEGMAVEDIDAWICDVLIRMKGRV